MTANINPIYSKKGDTTSDGTTGMAPTLVTATGDYTGVSANHALVFTADATNGGLLSCLRFKAIGANTATVARIYINNGSDHTTASNNSFYGEQSLPTIVASNVTATSDIDYPMGFPHGMALAPGQEIWVGLATTVASGWVVTPIAGQY